MMNSLPKIETRKSHTYAAVSLQVPLPFGNLLQTAWSQVGGWLAERKISHGPAIIRYLTTDMSTKLDIEVGFVLDQRVSPGDGIRVDVMPAGRYATLLYTGPYRGKGVYKANVTLIEWAKENGIAWKTSKREGVEWWASRVEWYFNDPATEPDPSKYKTELTFMVE